MSKSKTNKEFENKIKTLENIEPFDKCKKCGNTLLITIDIEPINSEYFKNQKIQKCIVECNKCKTKYVSNYDS